MAGSAGAGWPRRTASRSYLLERTLVALAALAAVLALVAGYARHAVGENQGGAAPWYLRAYDELLQETPFSFPRAEPLLAAANLATTCAPNRGPADAPLFLVNHWVTTDPLPRPSDADAVNAYGPLLARLRECERVRDHIPNLAVDFPRHGDLYRAVDAFNGVR